VALDLLARVSGSRGGRAVILRDAASGLDVDELSILPASSRDLPSLVSLVNLAFERREGWLIPGPRLAPGAVSSELAGAGIRMLVARAYGRPVGCVRLRTQGPVPDPLGVPELGLLAVAPELQGAGLGTALVYAAEALAVRSGFDVVHLQCGRELGTEGWYEALGYERIAEEHGTRWGSRRAFTLVTLRRRVRKGAPRSWRLRG
jgi:predicted N-acetyltransferase YhbS